MPLGLSFLRDFTVFTLTLRQSSIISPMKTIKPFAYDTVLRSRGHDQ
jgi:hypothetical protein